MVVPSRIILTGEKGAGKTTLCQHLVEQARELGMNVRGVISPAIFEAGQKVGIGVVDLKDSRFRRLAYTHEHKTKGPATEGWAFAKEVVEWGNEVLKESTPCDLLIVDELGPLEFERGQGWLHGFAALDQGEYNLALVVIRPELTNQALARWPDAEIIELTSIHKIETRIMQILHPRHP